VTGSALPPKLSVELGEREIWQLDHLSKFYVIISLFNLVISWITNLDEYSILSKPCLGLK
jgi:hypothetical protein